MRYVILAAVLTCSVSVFGQQVGNTIVVVAEKEAKLKQESRVVGVAARGTFLRVDEINGEWYWVQWGGEKGWINRRDVLSLDRALDYFTSAIQSEPKPEDYSSRGRIWYEKGEFDKAIADYSVIARLFPDQAEVYYTRGRIWCDKGEFDKAIADYSEVMRLQPSPMLACMTLHSRGRAWYRKGEYDKAIADYNEEIRLASKHRIPYIDEGLVWNAGGKYVKGKHVKATTDYRTPLQLDPKYAIVYHDRGTAWKAKGEYNKATTDYNKALELHPEFAIGYSSLAWLQATCPDARYRNGRQAVENARQACELSDWQRWDFVSILAAVYAKLGEFDEAVKWQNKAVELAPRNKQAECQSRLEVYESGKP